MDIIKLSKSLTEYSALQMGRQIISNWDLGFAKVGP